MHCFFQKSTPGFQKWTKINVHFQKSSFRFEKKKHHSLLGGLGMGVFPAIKLRDFWLCLRARKMLSRDNRNV
jgi:hypothetical protein